MKCAFWNSRGVEAPGRKQCIDDTIVPLKVDYIGFQETKKEKFSNSFLKNILGNRNFIWNFLPARGSAGGILVGISGDLFDVVSWDIRKFSVSVIASFKADGKLIRITTVYGSAYECGKQDFLSELHSLFIDWDGPAIIGGDFNLVRSQEDKNNRAVDFKWVDKFNAWIEIWGLMEINVAGRHYTWSNNQENLVMSRIDRVFCTTSFEALFPLAKVEALARLGSDHTPLIWDSGCSQPPRKSGFKFEKWWSTRPDFREVVCKAWSTNKKARNVVDMWQSRLGTLEDQLRAGVQMLMQRLGRIKRT